MIDKPNFFNRRGKISGSLLTCRRAVDGGKVVGGLAVAWPESGNATAEDSWLTYLEFVGQV
ncbi:hypothetical protein HPP92_014233 [Vanilla planifolia]|uniref:Uncharacterized protein n=1 Tax=Vanilla planifolia TaxID=51239 RepID=A0A835QGH5_VANPL|nr:hypothetical protein HPP92_014692 [Vanilla planifolia]KAG0474523.1 hypothetical protein HPP92_014209 [Vanilla planifolia]KAG0474547.1 hypothetical protein HPP92_014233 [Vanilla planifolia]